MKRPLDKEPNFRPIEKINYEPVKQETLLYFYKRVQLEQLKKGNVNYFNNMFNKLFL